MSKTDSQKLDMIFDAIVGMKQEITEVKLKVTDMDQRLIRVENGLTKVENRLSKVELDIETLKDNQKAIIEGQQTATLN